MNTELLQHGVVTMVAMGAGVIILRRAIGFVFGREQASPSCGSCASSASRCGTPARGGSATTHPAVLIRSNPR
jgi:hypothetical protein